MTRQWQARAGIRSMDFVIAIGLAVHVYDVLGH